MKPWKKLLLGLAGIFALTSLAACSSSTNTLDKVKNKGTLTVALNPHFAPFEFKTIQDGKDTIAGADIEIAKAIGDELLKNVRKFSTFQILTMILKRFFLSKKMPQKKPTNKSATFLRNL